MHIYPLLCDHDAYNNTWLSCVWGQQAAYDFVRQKVRARGGSDLEKIRQQAIVQTPEATSSYNVANGIDGVCA